MPGQSAKHKQDVINYYEATRVEYRLLWRYRQSLSMHFGYYDKTHTTHDEAVANLNAKLADLATITEKDYVLDAGCGVGGTAIWLAKNIGCSTTGISLVPRQINKAKSSAKEHGVVDKTSFAIGDFAATGFPSNTFTAVLFIESLVHAEDKEVVLKEIYRVLKPGGRLIISEYMLKPEPLSGKEQKILARWLKGWAMPSILSEQVYEDTSGRLGFTNFRAVDWTQQVSPSLRRADRWATFFKFIGPFLYALRLVNKDQLGNRAATTSQMKLLKSGSWRYKVILATKP